MRKVTFGCASSLDNFIARSDHSVDWLMWSNEVAAITAEFWKTIDTVLMGRKTYEVAARSGQAGGYPGVKNYVFSRTLEATPAGVSLIRDDAAEFVRDMKSREGKDICVMGGGELARALFEAALIDEVGVNIHPVLLGRGIPLFHPMTRPFSLALKECRQFENGCIYVLYGVSSQ